LPYAIDVAWQLGISPHWSMEDTHGGACGINMLQHAARAIQAGDANVIVILAGDHFQPSDFKELVENYNRRVLAVAATSMLPPLCAQRRLRAMADFGAD
jgi:hypothetical protein